MDVLRQLSNLKNLADGDTQRALRTKPEKRVQDQRRLKPDQIIALVQEYANGAGTTHLACEFGIHRTTVWQHLERAGIPRRPAKRKLTDDQVRQAAERYKLGLSIAAVANEFDVDAETIRREFIRAEVPRRQRSSP